MVEGLQGQLRPVCIVDLDGTLLIGNSMKRFMRWLPKRLFEKGEYVRSIQSLLWSGLRAMRLISHRRMKWHLSEIATRSLPHTEWRNFAESLHQAINGKVMAKIVELQREGASVCIASAAMAGYVVPLSEILGFLTPIATPHTLHYSQYVESRGDKKLSDINSMLDELHLQVCCFLTDHHDDLPTALAFMSQTILVNPRPLSASIFKQAGITSIL